VAYFADGANKDEYEELFERARSELHEGVEEKDILKRLRFKWEERHRPEIKAKYDAYRKSAELDYLELTPKKTIVLCNRCHYARERGLVLCRVCGEHYHKPKYPMCLECAQKKTP
jgi:hypothetical protein